MLETRYQKLVMTLIVLTGVCSGFDIGVISGTLPLIKTELDLNVVQISEIAGVVFFGALLSKLFSGFLMDFLGRKTVIAIGSFVFSIAMVLMVLSTNYISLMLSRLLQGISIGFLLTVIPVYIAESSTINFRGRSMGIFQLSLASGIFLANVLASIFAVRYGWRVVFILAIPFSIMLFLLTFIAPYSPVWLQMKGRSKEARETSIKLFSTFQEKLENHINKKTGFEEFLTAVKSRKNLFLLILVSFLAVLNGFVGINLLISFGPTIFTDFLPSLKDSASNYGSVLTLINLLATVVGIFFVDKIGRRKLIIFGLIISLIFMILTMVSINLASYKLALLFILITTFGGAVGPAVCIWLVLSEVLPSSLRATGISVALVSKALLESIFISSFLGLVASYGYTPIFGIMALCMLTFIILVYKFLPEMANKELL